MNRKRERKVIELVNGIKNVNKISLMIKVNGKKKHGE